MLFKEGGREPWRLTLFPTRMERVSIFSLFHRHFLGIFKLFPHQRRCSQLYFGSGSCRHFSEKKQPDPPKALECWHDGMRVGLGSFVLGAHLLTLKPMIVPLKKLK